MLMSLVILTHTVLEEQAEEPGQVLCNSLRVLLEAWCGSLPLCASDPASCSPEARASTGLWWWKPKLCANLTMLLVSPADTHQVGQCSVGQLSLRREESPLAAVSAQNWQHGPQLHGHRHGRGRALHVISACFQHARGDVMSK